MSQFWEKSLNNWRTEKQTNTSEIIGPTQVQ